MGWRDLLQTGEETLVSPWVGGRSLRSEERYWKIDGKLPVEHGWYTFHLVGRKANQTGEAAPQPDDLRHLVRGYLVGDRVVPDGARVDPDPAQIVHCSERVYLLEPGLDRFVRVSAGRTFDGGPLVYQTLEMPLGPEGDVLGAFLDGLISLDQLKSVPPALDAAFRMEVWQRQEAERRRIELEKLRQEEEERRQREERRQQLVRQLGDAAGRREMAKVDFSQAARAALLVTGAQYLDHRAAYHRNEKVVRFRFRGQRFECICDDQLRIVDAGICLTDHDTGEKGDTRFTLESLPSVIKEAMDLGKLVVYRHVD